MLFANLKNKAVFNLFAFLLLQWLVFFTGIGCVSPINDLTVGDASLYTKNEKLLRCKLSALCRIVDLFGWSNTIFNHITVSVS